MKLKQAQEIISETDVSSSSQNLIEALSTISKHLSKSNIDTIQYANICKRLLQNVAPHIVASQEREVENADVILETIFLKGNPYIAFSELYATLNTQHPACETAAKIVVVFVNNKINGSARLAQVIAKADNSEIVSSLVHLPTKLLNILMSIEDDHSKGEIFDEPSYYAGLADAIYAQSTTSDMYRDRIIELLLSRLVVIKQVDILVQRFIASRDTEKVATVILKAPQNILHEYVRALLNLKVSFEDEVILQEVLRILISKNKVIEDAVVSNIPLQRPLFKRPRSSLRWLVNAVRLGSGMDITKKGLIIASEHWSSEDFVKGADILLQRQVTRLIFYYMQVMRVCVEDEDEVDPNSIMMILAQGVHFRLSENDVRLKRHGMVIGEAASRYCRENEPLKFDRHSIKNVQKGDEKVFGNESFEDGGDSDFSDLANGDAQVKFQNLSNSECLRTPSNNVQDISAYEDVHVSQSTRTNMKSESEETNVTASNSTKRKNKWRRNAWPNNTTDNNWQDNDDWSSISSYELTSSSDDDNTSEGVIPKRLRKDYEELRKKLSAPMSVPRLLGLLREICSPDGATNVDGEIATAALRTLASRASQSFMQRGTLHSAAVELCIQVCQIDCDQYPNSEMPALIKARAEAYKSCLQLDIGRCGIALIERIICGEQSDISRRSEALSVLSSSVREAYKRWKKETTISPDEMKECNSSDVSEIGTVTRRLSESVRISKARRLASKITPKEKAEWDIKGIEGLFHCLAGRLCEGGGASFLNIEDQDSRLWAQGLVTLATIGCHGGTGNEGARMRHDVMEISVRRVGRLNADGVVRRSIALALGAVISSMEDIEIKENLASGVSEDIELSIGMDERDDVGKECVEWLYRSVNNDSDVGVRRFASIGLRKLIARVEAVSS